MTENDRERHALVDSPNAPLHEEFPLGARLDLYLHVERERCARRDVHRGAATARIRLKYAARSHASAVVGGSMPKYSRIAATWSDSRIEWRTVQGSTESAFTRAGRIWRNDPVARIMMTPARSSAIRCTSDAQSSGHTTNTRLNNLSARSSCRSIRTDESYSVFISNAVVPPLTKTRSANPCPRISGSSLITAEFDGSCRARIRRCSSSFLYTYSLRHRRNIYA